MRKRYLHNRFGEGDAFWDQNWEGDWRRRLSTRPFVWPRLAACMMKYLAPNMLLLEGGCGDGRYVRFFSNRGVRTIGIDFARRTVETINDLMPDLDVRLGDIRRLEFPDGHFDAYYSGGVIEHFEDGVGPQVAEAHRVLKTGGVFFVTVPHMNVIRKCAATFCPTRTKFDLDGRTSFHKDRVREFLVDTPPDDFHFHEYVFSAREMRRVLVQHHFTIVEEMCLYAASGLCDIALYRTLIGADRRKRSFVNRVFAIPLRLVRAIENADSRMSGRLSEVLGAAFGNLKLYVCKAEK